jgi:hypothetical protein
MEAYRTPEEWTGLYLNISSPLYYFLSNGFKFCIAFNQILCQENLLYCTSGGVWSFYGTIALINDLDMD